MKRAIFLTCLSAAALTIAGCGKTVVRETVVERPVVKETIVEKPVIQRETIVQTPTSCTLAGTTFSTGAMSCQGGWEYRCDAATWSRTGRSC